MDVKTAWQPKDFFQGEVTRVEPPMQITVFWNAAMKGEFPFQDIAELEAVKTQLEVEVVAQLPEENQAMAQRFLDHADHQYRSNGIVAANELAAFNSEEA